MILKGIILIVGVLLIAAVVMFLKLAADSRKMTVTDGLENDQLRSCPASPNCVSSDMPVSDSHYVIPIADPGGTVWASLKDKISAMDGVELVHEDSNYLHFTFRSAVLGFIDDVEFYNRPANQEIAVRSASRVGYSDWNANSKRINRIRETLTD